MNHFIVKATVLTVLSLVIASNYSTTVNATQARINLAKPDTGVLALNEQVTEDQATAVFTEGGEAALATLLHQENQNTHEQLNLDPLEVPENILNASQTRANFGNIKSFNNFYYQVSNSCQQSPEAQKVTPLVRLRDRINGFFAMAFSDPQNLNQYISSSSYGGWGDIHFTGPYGSRDYHGVPGKFMQLISNHDVQITASTARWGNSPATIATAYYALAKDDSGNTYHITMGQGGLTVTKNGAAYALVPGKNILSPNLVLDNYGANGTIYTKNFSFTYAKGDRHMNFGARQTGSAFTGAVALGGLVGRQMARATTGSSASMWDNVNPFGGAYNQADAWSAFDGFGQNSFPVQDGTNYIPTAEKLTAGLFKKPNGQPAYKPSEICGAPAQP